MRLLWHKTTTKVFGDSGDKNEDVFLIKPPHESIRRFVMCDGATSSFAARAWASLIVKSFAEDNGRSDRERVYDAASGYETQYPPTAMAGMEHCAIEAFKRGSSSTLLLIVQDGTNHNQLHITAVGDSCCFVVDRRYHVIKSFPIAEPKIFSTSTPLVTVTFEGLRQLFDEQVSGYYWRRLDIDVSKCRGVKIICATDAISQWIAARKASPRSISRLMKAVKTKGCDEFVKFVERERARKKMSVDDSSIAILEI